MIKMIKHKKKNSSQNEIKDLYIWLIAFKPWNYYKDCYVLVLINFIKLDYANEVLYLYRENEFWTHNLFYITNKEICKKGTKKSSTVNDFDEISKLENISLIPFTLPFITLMRPSSNLSLTWK